jgi:hypothetical protein
MLRETVRRHMGRLVALGLFDRAEESKLRAYQGTQEGCDRAGVTIAPPWNCGTTVISHWRFTSKCADRDSNARLVTFPEGCTSDLKREDFLHTQHKLGRVVNASPTLRAA